MTRADYEKAMEGRDRPLGSTYRTEGAARTRRDTIPFDITIAATCAALAAKGIVGSERDTYKAVGTVWNDRGIE